VERISEKTLRKIIDCIKRTSNMEALNSRKKEDIKKRVQSWR